ncbi:MAG TPA: acetoin utilization protein AcuC, partial [Actinomycetes bacterium]|nr:acetoin utilization protein AcuC [Actinomycetes bacterium]
MSGACAVAADERLAAYDFGPDRPFQAGRLEAGLSLLRAAKVLDDDDLLAFGPAGDADLELIHDRDYLEAVARFSADPPPADPAEATRFGLVGDNRPFPGLDQAARLVTGATMAALDAVAGGDLAHVFAPVAGLHHAQRRRAVGFCVVNDVAVAIARATRAWPLRVLYVDLDAHHGDGVQAAFYDDPRVCTVSLHETGRYLFPGTGEVHELGRPPGSGRSVNVPLEPRTGDDGFLDAFDAVVEPLAAAFRPDLLVTQNGCDGHADDPLSDLALTLRGYRELARRLHKLAHRHCQGRWVATGGGGYDLDRVVPRAWAVLWSELSGRRLPARVPPDWLAARPERNSSRSTGAPR